MNEIPLDHARKDRTSDGGEAPDETSAQTSNDTSSEPSNDTSFEPSNDPEAEASDACVVCGSPIETREWHPIVAVSDADGELSLYLFCHTDCREAWDGS